MGFSSKQVPLNGFDWTHNLVQSSGAMEFSKSNPCLIQQQQQQQFAQPLNCPRCDSTNTKFCYYNNYNRTQPRHYCKSCKRHWTKGGILRNVPVGGVRKNKRQKTNNNKSKNNSNSKKTVTDCSGRKLNNNLVAQMQQQQKQEQEQEHIQLVSTSCDFQKKDTTSEFLHESLINPTSTTARRQNLFSAEDSNSFMGSSSIDPIPMFQFTCLSSIDHNHQQQHNLSLNPSSTFSNVGFQSSSSNDFNYSGDAASIESASPWQAPNSSNFINPSSINWSWEDLNTFMLTDLKQPWENDQTIVNLLPI